MQVTRLKLSGQDDIGGIVQVKTTILNTPCRVRQLNASERLVGGKSGVVSTHRIYCKKVDIRNKDEVIISKTVYDVNTTNPLSVNDNRMEVDVTLRG